MGEAIDTYHYFALLANTYSRYTTVSSTTVNREFPRCCDDLFKTGHVAYGQTSSMHIVEPKRGI